MGAYEIEKIPSHLKKYIVDQNYEKYTPVDQAVWRYIMRQLRNFLKEHAHECYLDGLEKTGVTTDSIPRIEAISEKISQFGWKALPVSGFIPPAAFMELQSLGFLPIASDMRTLDHLLYTPAPDIVHEAAGHAPILINKEFANYLKAYAEVARKAIISKEDLALYEGIRVLSDAKENPLSTKEKIKELQENLDRISKNMSHVSEAGELSRMNWWTAEYGLIGEIENPKIFGAGLLSSVGESKWCLSKDVKKIPLTVNCIKQSYDITEPQPQLFVARDFNVLMKVLEEMANQMAFRTGGLEGLQKSLKAQTVNAVQLNSGIQISGELDEIIPMCKGGTPAQSQGVINASVPAYLRFRGPTQLAFQNKEIAGHGKDYHSSGFGTPIGFLAGASKCLSEFTAAELKELGVIIGNSVSLKFQSGVQVNGTLKGIMTKENKNLIFAFDNCQVVIDQNGSKRVLFEPSWGMFDMAVGSQVVSVFGGAADREAYGETEDFVVERVPQRKYSRDEIVQHEIYRKVRKLRESLNVDRSEKFLLDFLPKFVEFYSMNIEHRSDDWLVVVETLEVAQLLKKNFESQLRKDSNSDSKSEEVATLIKKIDGQLSRMSQGNTTKLALIEDGIKLSGFEIIQ